MKFIPRFGKPEYQAPAIKPVPEDQKDKVNGVLINEERRCFRVEIFDHNEPQDLVMALGILEVAKDVVKQTLTAWHERERRRNGIIVPEVKANGHGGN